MCKNTTTEKVINAKTLYKTFVEAFKKHIKGVRPPIFQVKYMSLLKKLYMEQGGEKAEEYILYFIANYDFIKGQLRLRGYPNISVLWSFRTSILEMMNEPRKNSIEYTPTTASKNKGRKIKVEQDKQTSNVRTTQKGVFLSS